MPIEWRTATYSRAFPAAEYAAVEVEFSEIREHLGRDHDGSPEDDDAVVAALVASGAPAWVIDAEGYLDDGAWGLIGPVVR